VTQALLAKMWTKSIHQMRNNVIRIKCLTPNNIYIRDLNRTFLYNVEEVLTEREYYSSKELQIAVQRKQVVLSGLSDATQQAKIQTQQQPFQLDREMLKGIVSEVADELLGKILQSLPQAQVQHVTVQQITEPMQQMVERKIQAVDIEEETFVRMTSDETESTNTNLNAQVEQRSLVTEQVLSSLAKMKAMKKKKVEEE